MTQDREGVCLAGGSGLALRHAVLAVPGSVQVEMSSEQLEMCIWELGEIWT